MSMILSYYWIIAVCLVLLVVGTSYGDGRGSATAIQSHEASILQKRMILK